MKKHSLIVSFALLIGLSISCKKNDPGAACTEANLNAKVDGYLAAVTTYGNSPTPANCKAVLVSYDNYLTVAQNCSYVSKAQIDAIQQSRADLAKTCQ